MSSTLAVFGVAAPFHTIPKVVIIHLVLTVEKLQPIENPKVAKRIKPWLDLRLHLEAQARTKSLRKL